MIGTIHITGEIGVDTTLLDVIKQVKAQSHSTEFLITINSIGGFVDSGMAIYNYLKSLPQVVNTYCIQAYSIASVIFMAGQRRIANDANNVLMIHNPWMEVAGSHEVITNHLKDLKATEDNLVKFYSEALSIDRTTILSLLQQETFLSAEQALQLGFATEIKSPQKAVARLHNKEEKQLSMNKIEKKIEAIYNKLMGVKSELVLQDATGENELVFADLEPTEVAETGATATIDGAPADGEILMPDGTTLVFEKGTLNEIKPAQTPEDEAKVANAEGDEDASSDADADKDSVIAELEAKVAVLQAKIDELMSSEQVDKLMQVIESSLEKNAQLETKFLALAKSIGSDFKIETPNQIMSAITAKDVDAPKFSIKRK